MGDFLRSMYQKPKFGKRFLFCLVAVLVMGFCVSWLSAVNLGTDPCSAMNFGLSSLLGMSFGNWQALLNCGLFVIVLALDRSGIGFGTVLNMFLVGYACDFTTWLRLRLFPGLTFDSMPVRLVVMAAILALFVVAVGVYMSVDLGTSPYDAIPLIIAKRQKRVSFRVVRILYDCAVVVIAFFAGSTIGIATILMAFTIGPVAAYVKKYIDKLL